MRYYAQYNNSGKLIAIGTGNCGTEITESEYNTLLTEFEAKWKQEAEQNAPSNPYGIDDITYNNIIDDYTSSITEEVASNGY